MSNSVTARKEKAMLVQEWKSLLKNRMLLIVLAGIIAIPAIYTTLFLGSMWDPYGNLSKLPVAVVNLDQSVEYEGATLRVGEELEDKLRENEELDFQFVKSEDAEKGLENGDYYMPIDLLEVGKKYYYQEITAPEIFELNTDKHEFTLNKDFTPSITTVDNLRKTSTIRLSKTDLLGGNKIPNCTFELRSEEIDFVVTGTTDENGEYYFENIPYGTYTYTELSAPEEYIIDTTPHRIIVDEEIEEINVSNELRVNTSDINVMLFTILLIASSIGIIYIFYSKKELIKEKINKNK